MKIKQMILTVVASLMVSESHSVPDNSDVFDANFHWVPDNSHVFLKAVHAFDANFYSMDMGFRGPEVDGEAFKIGLCREQAQRFFQGSPPVFGPTPRFFSNDALRKSLVRFENRLPVDYIVPAVDFCLAHMGGNGGEKDVPGFNSTSWEGLRDVFFGLEKSSPDDYEPSFRDALAVVGQGTGDGFRDSLALSEAFKSGSGRPQNARAVALEQLKGLRSDTRGKDAAVYGELVQGQWDHSDSSSLDFFTAFLKFNTLLNLPSGGDAYVPYMASAARDYCDRYRRDHGKSPPLNEETLYECVKGTQDIEFLLALDRLSSRQIDAGLRKVFMSERPWFYASNLIGKTLTLV